MAVGVERIVMIGKQRHEAKHAEARWQSPLRPGVHGSFSDAFLNYSLAVEQNDVVENLDRLRDSLLVCDCLAHELCHGDFPCLNNSFSDFMCRQATRASCELRTSIKEEGYIFDFCNIAGNWPCDPTLVMPVRLAYAQQCLQKALIQKFPPKWVADVAFSPWKIWCMRHISRTTEGDSTQEAAM